MNIKVTKLTDESLLHKANSFTTGKESKMSLKTAYRSLHTPIRTQLFWIELIDVPLFAASQIIRSHVGMEKWMLTKRTDRGAKDFREVCKTQSTLLMDAYSAVLQGNKEAAQHNILCVSDNLDELPKDFDRYAPTSLAVLLNAEAIINMSHKRLCTMASKETREIWEKVCELIEECDPDLYPHLVKPCVACGVCREKCCSYIYTDKFRKERENYKSLFR